MDVENESRVEHVEVMHNGISKTYRDFTEAFDFAKKLTQYEDEHPHAYIIRKVKIGHLPSKSYMYRVSWVEGSMWLITDWV